MAKLDHHQRNGSRGEGPPSHRKSAVRREVFRELIRIANEQGATIATGISTGDALQECLDRAVAYMRFAASQVDQLMVVADDPQNEIGDGFFVYRTNPQGPAVVEPNRWFKMEREARLEVEKLAAMMTQLGIAERVVRVEEAKAALVVAAVREAAIDAGLSHDQVRALGMALRDRVEDGLGQKRQKSTAHSGPERRAAIKTLRESQNEVEGIVDDEP